MEKPTAKESPAETISRECLAARMRVLNRVISGIYDEALRPFGLRISQLNILVAIARLGSVQPARLSQLLHMDASTVSRNVERMQKRGWIEVRPGEDGRAQLLRLTAEGDRLLEDVAEPWARAQQQTTEMLGGEQVRALEAMTRPLLSGEVRK